MPAVAKLCTVCGNDVAGKKRVKDAEGRYFCDPCFATRASAPHVSLGTTQPAAPADDGILDLAPEPKKAEEPMFGCAGCKKLVPQRQVRNVDGEFLCSTCASKRTTPQRPVAKTKPAVGRPEDDENPERWTDSLTGGLAVGGGILVFAFVLLTALHYFRPGAFGGGLGMAAFLGGVESVFILVKTAGLMTSMLIAASILGGITFGTFGSAVYKSIGLFTALAVFDLFIGNSLFLFGFGFRFVAMMLCFVVVYGIDWFEAHLLAIINIAMSWGVTILMGILLIFAVSAISGTPAGNNDWDDEEEEMVAPADKAKDNKEKQPEAPVEHAPLQPA
jgi:hypothetical protein